MANWFFEEISENSMDKKDPSQYTVQSHDTKLSNIQIFLREAVQNVGDSLNKILHKTAILDFELVRLNGNEKKEFINNINYNELIPHFKSVRADQQKRRAANIFADPEDLINSSKSLRLLYINDKNTYGLTGGEFGSENIDENELKSFIGLCRGTGGNEKGENVSSGGTNGYGKSVLWKHSDLSLVFFYSRLSKKYTDPNGVEHSSRLIGICRMADHYLNAKPLRGIVNFGNSVPGSQNIRSVYDNEADLLASKLGFPERNNSDFGTSILIVGFQDLSEDEKSDLETIKDLKHAAEEFYWPSIVDKELDITFSFRNGEGYEVANPLTNSKINPFVDIYFKRDANEIASKSLDIDVPKNEIAGFVNESKSAKINIYAKIYEDTEPSSIELLNHIALIRGSKMVIKYEKAFNFISGKSFNGLVLAGTLIEESDIQKHLEKLLALSEPISHDDWNQNSDNLKDWRGGKARIKQIKDLIKREFNEITSNVIEPEGDAAPALSKMFSFEKGENTEMEPRKIKQSGIVISPQRYADGKGYFLFEFDINVPPKENFEMKQGPEKWRLLLKCGSVGENSKNNIIVSYSIKLTEIRKNNNVILTDSEFANEKDFEDNVTDEDIRYSFKGISDLLEPSEIDFSKVELQIETFKI